MVFPLPFGPRIPKNSLFSTLKSMCSIIMVSSYPTDNRWTSSILSTPLLKQNVSENRSSDQRCYDTDGQFRRIDHGP
ncbi:caleosin family protein [Rossellomorea aquimaris]|nr:caleosin family protein [Rossellomorea aquimaris]